MRISRVCALACVVSIASGVAARADVLEIASNGDLAIINGPVVVTSEATTPILAPTISRAAPVRERLQQAAQANALSPDLVSAIAWVESRFNDGARSPAGAIGVMQLMPATAADLGVNPTDPVQNAQGGATYVRQMLDSFDGDITLALAAYNAGPEAVRRHHGVPPYAETQAYVARVLDFMADQASQETSSP